MWGCPQCSIEERQRALHPHGSPAQCHPVPSVKAGPSHPVLPCSSHTGPSRTIVGAGNGSLLGCRIVQLVFPGSAEAGLHSRVSPEPFDDSSQLRRHHPLLGTPCQHKQLPGIVLQDREHSLGCAAMGTFLTDSKGSISAFINHCSN